MKAHRVSILALDGVLPLDFGIPAQIFSRRPQTPYRLTVCGETPTIAVTEGYSLALAGTLADARRADTLIVPGFWPYGRELSNEVLDTIRHVHERGRRLVSICVGAFALAQAGVLDGLTATTHWQRADEFAETYPRVVVNRKVLYVDEGQVLTSAGVAAGIDLCLHLVRRDLGATIANTLARLIVAAPHRDGGQAQFVGAPVGRDSGSLAAVRAWAVEHLHEPITVGDLARESAVSERTLARRWIIESGLPPLQWLLRARVERARELIEADNLALDAVAQRCGLGTAANLRLHFRRHVGTTPTAYRNTFGC